MRTMVVWWCLAALAGSPAAASGQAGSPEPLQAAARFAGKLQPCRVTPLEEALLCGTHEVPEDPARPDGRRVPLNIVVLPATTADVAPDPVVYLAGGGVMPATRYAAMFGRSFPKLRERRDILLVDQRGTGKSNPLTCPDLTPGPPKPETQDRHVAELKRCRAALEGRADLRFYGTEAAMDDLAGVVSWLGYRQINVYGMSYGTKAAQVFLKRHPALVRAVALHGTMALDAPMWLDLASSAQRSFDRVAGACGADEACRSAFGDVRAKLDQALARVAKTPTDVPAESEDGKPVTVHIDDRTLRDFLNVMLTSSRSIADVPLIIHEAADGHFARLAGILAQETNAPPSPIPKGLFLTLLCGESMPQVDRTRIGQATSSTFVGEFPLRYQIAECGVWPIEPAPARLYEPVRSDVPVLLLTGELDNTTPPVYADHVAAMLSRGRVVRLPWRSHNDGDSCVMSLIEAFLIAGDHTALDTSCVTGTQPITFRLSGNALK
jgi:pimeloyl-ACP methyl ester carboxylesterase